MENIHDVQFYAIAWIIAAICGMAITALNRDYRNYWDVCAIGFLCGFASVGIIQIVCWVTDLGPGDEQFSLFIAVAVGFMGRKCIEAVDKLYQTLLKRLFRVEIDEHSTEETNSSQDEDTDN